MKKSPGLVVMITAVSTMTAVYAVPVVSAQTPTTAISCPSVQIVTVNDSSDSAVGNVYAGFLAQVTDPVVKAANDGNMVGLAAGFTQPVPTTLANADKDSWKPDVWGTRTTTPSAKPTVIPTTSTSAVQDNHIEVGRTVIQVASTNDTRAYIPGVTGPDSTPAYEESITRAASDTGSVLEQIARQCPATKVGLLGVGQGAQAVSIVSKKIGAGEVFDSSKVIGVAMFADPSRAEGQPVVANGATTPVGAPSQWNVAAVPGAGAATVTKQTVGADIGGYGALSDRAVSWCAEGDMTCALPENTPLRTLMANGAAGIYGRAPEHALTYVADILGPAVLLGTVETLAQDIQFGSGGFTFTAASSPKKTLIGRIAAESGSPVEQSEMQQRLTVASMQIGGMALAAGITIAKEVLAPENLAQIAVASAVSPAAGAGAALLIAGKAAATELVSTQTLTSGARRLASEAKAVGIDDDGIAQAAVQAAVGSKVSKTAGTYKTAGMTVNGESAAQATTSWLANVVGQEIGKQLHTGIASQSVPFDSAAVATALAELV